MYHASVRAQVRRLWQRAETADYPAAVVLASSKLHFHLVGDAPPGAERCGPE